MANLVLGPLLRYVSETEATVWVETRRALRGRDPGPPSSRPSGVEEHHYALVRLEDLEPGGFLTSTRLRLDGERRWPGRLQEPAAERDPTLGRAAPLDVCFGSCRVALPHEEPYVHGRTDHEDGFELDALRVLATADGPTSEHDRAAWSCSFLLGDQVYADEGSPRTRERIRERRGTETPPGDEVARLRGVHLALRGVLERPADPLAVLDGLDLDALGRPRHERRLEHLRAPGCEEMREKSWWHRARPPAAMTSYWVYQHLGNLSPRRPRRERALPRGRAATSATAAAARVAAEQPTPTAVRLPLELLPRLRRHPRLVFIDSRAGRVLEEGKRSMVDEDEWEWIVEHAPAATSTTC